MASKLSPAINNLFYLNLPFFDDKEGQMVFNKIKDPQVDIDLPILTGSDVQKKEELARQLVYSNFINKREVQKKSEYDLDLLKSVVNDPGGDEASYFVDFIQPILDENGLESNAERLLNSFENPLRGFDGIESLNHYNKTLKIPKESIDYLNDERYKYADDRLLEDLIMLTGGITLDKSTNRKSVTDDKLFQYVSNIIKKFIDFNPTRDFVTKAQNAAKEVLDVKPEYNKEIFPDKGDFRHVTINFPGMSPDGSDISMRVNMSIPDISLDPEVQKHYRDVIKNQPGDIKKLDMNILHGAGERYLNKIVSNSNLSAMEDSLKRYNGKEYREEIIALVDIARQLNIEPEISFEDPDFESTTVNKLRSNLFKDHSKNKTSPYNIARQLNNNKELKGEIDYNKKIIKSNHVIDFLYEYYKKDGVSRTELENVPGREDVVPELKITDILKNTTKADRSEKALDQLADQVMNSYSGRQNIEQYTKNRRNYEDIQYIDPEMAEDILRGNDDYKLYFNLSADGSSLEKVSWDISAGTGYTYEHVVPVFVLTSIINYIITNVENVTDRKNMINKVIDSMYRIAYVPSKKDSLMNKTELQSELPEDIYQKIGIDSIEKVEGKNHNIINLENGLDIDDLMKNIEDLTDKDLQKRYDDFGIPEIIPLKNMFKGKKEIPLYQTKATDRKLKGEVNESKQPKLTSLIFGYYG